MPAASVAEVVSDAWVTLGYLTVGAVALQVYPTAAIFAYLALTFHLATKAYDAKLYDNTDGVMVLTSTVTTFGYMGLVYALLYMSPFAFANVSVFYGLLAWGAIVTFLVTFGSVYLSGIKKIHFFVCASYLSWAMNTILFYAYIYGRYVHSSHHDSRLDLDNSFDAATGVTSRRPTG